MTVRTVSSRLFNPRPPHPAISSPPTSAVNFAVFVLWHTLSRHAIEALTNDLSNQISHNVVRRIQGLVNEPSLATQAMTIYNHAGIMPHFPVTNVTSEFIDGHFADTNDIFDKCAYIYTGDDDGRFEGTEMCEPWRSRETVTEGRPRYCPNFGDERNKNLGLLGAPREQAIGPQGDLVFGINEAKYEKGTVFRNLTSIKFQIVNFDPRVRPWYKPPETGTGKWSEPYLFAGNPAVLGISVAQRNNATISKRWNRTVVGRTNAADLRFNGIDTFLRNLKLAPSSISNPGVVFIIERDGSLIGTMRGSSTYLNPDCLDADPLRVKCTSTTMPVDAEVKRASDQMVARLGGFATDKYAGTVGQGPLGAIVLRAAQIADPTASNLDWLCVVALNLKEFTKQFEAGVNRAILVVVGICIVAVCFTIMINADCSSRDPHKMRKKNAGGGAQTEGHLGAVIATGTGGPEDGGSPRTATNGADLGLCASKGGGAVHIKDEREDASELDENAIDEMNLIEHHEYQKTGRLPARIMRYYRFMRKVLQPQVDAALAVAAKRGVVKDRKKGSPATTATRTNIPGKEEPLPHELEYAVDIVLGSGAGKDSSLMLWLTSHAPRWVQVLNAVHKSALLNTVYSIFVFAHCAFVFIEAPMGVGFGRGGGMDVNWVLGFSLVFIVFHYVMEGMCMGIAWGTHKHRVIKSTSIVLLLITVMFVEWCVIIGGNRGSDAVGEAVARQGMRRACLVSDGKGNATEGIDECVLFCAAQLPRPTHAAYVD